MSAEAVVVKCGGNAAVDPQMICRDVAELRKLGSPVTLVHGGSADIEYLSRRLRSPMRTLTSPDGHQSRYTDPSTMLNVQMALCGLSKPRLLAELASHDVSALGITGLDAGLVRGRRKKALRTMVDGRVVLIRDDQSGHIDHVDGGLLDGLVALGLVPVLSPPVMSEEHKPINVDADRLAGAVAVATRAHTLLLLTGAPGLLRSSDDDKSLMRRVCLPDKHIQPRGGMARKLIAAEEALIGGVQRVVIADGRVPRPVFSALEGGGTRCYLALDHDKPEASTR